MTNPNLSHRASIIPASPIRKLAPLANTAKAKGLRVYHLNIGQPDIKSPQEFFEGLQKFSNDVIAYEQSKGNETLCQAWSSYMNKTTNLNTRPEQFQITAGGSEAIIFALMCCADPGDEIIVFDPTYANYIGFSVMGGIKLVSVAGDIDKDFHLPPVAEIEAAITPKTRAVILCNP
ncbi:MAG: aminotransferase class I/II-fold pyridoxal phosphate-dependent enzyme, partial [SAR324 cluster bacterium]|nr:aminotransferase class I/II-fold pyridoxal phosphate-dependent enzyme [SAR324 cluster bacterium]